MDSNVFGIKKVHLSVFTVIFSQRKKCPCEIVRLNEGVKLAIYIWRDETSQDQKNSGLNLPLRRKHFNLSAWYVITTCTTMQASLIRYTFPQDAIGFSRLRKTTMCFLFNDPNCNHCNKMARCSWILGSFQKMNRTSRY